MDGAVTADARDDAVQSGSSDPEDFDGWVAARGPALLRFAYLVTGNQHTAEDALASALASAYERWSRVAVMADPEAYVRRSVVNSHISWWRRFRRRELSAAEVRQPVGVGSAGPDHAVAVSEADLVWRLCASLPSTQRAAVVLRFYEDMPYAEIGGLLGCAEATVRSHVHRALASLRSLIEAQEAEQSQEDGDG